MDGRLAHFRRKNERSWYQISSKDPKTATNWGFLPNSILHKVKTGSVSGHFWLSVVGRTPTIRNFHGLFYTSKRVGVDSSSCLFL